MAGSSGVFVKHLDIPATSIAFIRTTIPTLVMGALMLIQGIAFFRGNYKLMLGASLLNALRLFFLFQRLHLHQHWQCRHHLLYLANLCNDF